MNGNGLYCVDTGYSGQWYKLYDLATWKNGAAFKNIKEAKNGLPIIKIAELNNGLSRNTVRTTDAFSDDIRLSYGDFLFAWSGNPETSIDIYRYSLSDGWLNQHIFKITVNEDLIVRDYFYYLMKYLKPNFRQIASNKQTTGLGHVTIADLKNFNVKIPSIATQQRIASILRSLDKKIEINNKINEVTEKQAQAFFDSFFSSELGDSFCYLSDIAEINPKRSLAKNAVAKYIDMSMLATSGPYPSGWDTKSYNGGMRFQNGDTLMARITPCLENGKVAYINFLNENETAFGSTEYIVFTAKKGYPNELFYFLTRNQKFIEFATKNMNGSSGRQRVSGEAIGLFMIPKLSDQQISTLTTITHSAMSLILQNCQESETLASLRDTLLPKLMSGEIKL